MLMPQVDKKKKTDNTALIIFWGKPFVYWPDAV